MERKRFFSLALCFLMLVFNASGAYLTNFPQKLIQPDRKVIHCFLSGDEYYSWLHDANNFTVIQDQKTGYYCYALSQNGVPVASRFIVGVHDPLSSGLQPGIQISPEAILKLRKQSTPDLSNEPEPEIKSALMNAPRTLNNIVIYVRFSDQTEFEPKQATYSSYFNSAETGANSMCNYFREVSYQKLNIVSSFYPLNNGTDIKSYQDAHIRNYYCPFTAQNDSGYSVTDGGMMKKEREYKLITNAIKFIRNQVPSSIDLDTDKDGKVDNICFIFRGNPFIPDSACPTILWPHSYKMYDTNVSLKLKWVYNYNIQLEDYLDYKQTGVLCHEMFHSLGAGDLYRYNGTPVGPWDIMAENTNPPQSMCAEYKARYGKWIDSNSIPEIKTSGHYSLNSISSAENNCYKINFSNPYEYYMLKFRMKSGTFESSLPGSGLIIYRIDKSACCRNLNGPPDWIYIFRPGDSNSVNGNIDEANFDASAGRSTFQNTAYPACHLNTDSKDNISIENILVSGNTVSFDVRFYNVEYSNTDQLPSVTKAINQIKTSGSVVVKNADRILFDSGEEILLNEGFEVKAGGQFETKVSSCGSK
jgi:M6 family metalloprotease-like protein